MKPLYEISSLSFSYQLGSREVQALKGVSLTLDEGEMVCFSGPSGSGKSTLLNILGLIEPSSSISFSGRDLFTLTEKEKNSIRLFDIGFIFQQFHLIPVLSAEENVEYFLIRQGLVKHERQKRVYHALSSVGLWDHRHHRPDELSGGQRQRVAVARAIAKQPKVIIADEPTANLDRKTSLEIIQLLVALNATQGVSIVIASHDPMVQDNCPRNEVLVDGSLTKEKQCYSLSH